MEYTKQEALEEISRLRAEKFSDAGRGATNDAIRRRDRDFELNDPRTRQSAYEIRADQLQSEVDRRTHRRQFDRSSFLPWTPDSEMTAVLAPIAETRVIVTEAAGLIFWRDKLGVKVTTETGAADPADEGFVLWFDRDRVEIARASDGTVQVSVPKWHWDRKEIEGLYALPGRTPIEA